MTLGDLGLTRVICQRVCDTPETIVILHFPVGGKFAITAAQVENLDVSDYFYKSDFRFSSIVKYENLDHKSSEIVKRPSF